MRITNVKYYDCVHWCSSRSAQLNFQLAKDRLAAHVNEFLKLLEDIQKFLEGIQGYPAAALSTPSKIWTSLQMMVDATKQQQMKVVFLGNTSNGKSTVINALVKRKVLPVGNGTITSCFCTITSMDCGEDGYVRIGDRQEELKVRHGPHVHITCTCTYRIAGKFYEVLSLQFLQFCKICEILYCKMSSP